MSRLVPKTKDDWRDMRHGENPATPNGTGVSIVDSDGAVHKTVVKFDAHTIAVADAAGVVAYASRKFLDLPAGAIIIHGVVANLTINKSSAGINNDFDGDFSVGTATAAGDATLTGTEANLIASTATPQATAGATTAKGRSTAAVYLDGTSTAVDLFLNILVDDADHDVTTTAANLIINGTITVIWSNMGDY